MVLNTLAGPGKKAKQFLQYPAACCYIFCTINNKPVEWHIDITHLKTLFYVLSNTQKYHILWLSVSFSTVIHIKQCKCKKKIWQHEYEIKQKIKINLMGNTTPDCFEIYLQEWQCSDKWEQKDRFIHSRPDSLKCYKTTGRKKFPSDWCGTGYGPRTMGVTLFLK